MKLSTITYIAFIAFMSAHVCVAANTNPVVTNVSFTKVGQTVTVTYDVADVEQSTVTILMNVSTDDGTTWDFSYGTASGAIGAGQSTGTGKTITWTYAGDLVDHMQIRIFANDGQVGGTDCGQVTYGGQTYNTIVIGNKCWFKENLNVGTYIIQTGYTPPGARVAQTNNSIVEKFCAENNTSLCVTRGGLYQWDEAMQYTTTEGAQGICPEGWHIPTYNELLTLKGASNNTYSVLATSGTNTGGFSSIPCGYYKDSDMGFYYGSWYHYLLSSTQINSTTAYNVLLSNLSSALTTNSGPKVDGYSIRCVKNWP